MKISELLAEGYPDTIAAFSQTADANQVKKTVDQYRDLVNRNQVQGNERNIDWWRRQGWEKFAQFVRDKSTQPSRTQVKRRRAAGRSITLKETDQWLIVIPLDHDASCFHGRDSEWCTARPTSHYFDEYFLDKEINLIYCINKESGDKYAIASQPSLSEIELFDQMDKSMTHSQFRAATGFDPRQLVALIPQDDPRIAQARQTRRDLLSRIQNRMKVWSQKPRQLPDLERVLIEARNSDAAAYYIIVLGRDHSWRLKYPDELSMMAVRSGLEGPFFDSLLALDDLELSSEDYPLNYIYEPSRAIQLASVKSSANTIQFIKNPTPEVQLAAAEKNPYVIRVISNPTPEVEKIAVHKDGSLLRYVKNHTPELDLAAVKMNGLALEFVKNPTPEIELTAINQNGEAIRFVQYPSPKLQRLAVDQNPKAIRYIPNPSLELQRAAVYQNNYVIQFIENPLPEIQLAAIREHPGVIGVIKNPTPEAVELARSRGYNTQGHYSPRM